MNDTTLSLAKTTQPTLSFVLERKQLFDKIDGTGAQRATWVAGSPGSGKTILVASYLAHSNRRALWYQLDSTDSDVATFFFYLRRTAIKHSKDANHALPELPATISDWSAYGRRLLREIFIRYNEPLVIVFDNYEALPPHSELHDVFTEMLAEVPQHSSLVFSGRLEPVQAFARARATNLLNVLHDEDTSLELDECRQLAELRHIDITDGDLERIYSVTTGWVTGTVLMLEHGRKGKTSTGKADNVSRDLLYDYFAAEIFHGFDTDTREFLLRVCWASRLSVQLAEKLSNNTSARQVLSNLSRNNYFVSERDDAEEIEFVIHPLLRDFLKRQALKQHGEIAVTEDQKHTALLLAESGYIEEAVELLAANLYWEPLEQLILAHASTLVGQGRSTLLASWLDQLPMDRLESHAGLLYLYGRARLPYSAREARRYFETAFRISSDSEDEDSRELLCCCGVMEAVLLEMDDYSLLDNWINILDDLVANEHESGDESLRARAAVILLLARAIRSPSSITSEKIRSVQRTLRATRSTISTQHYEGWLIISSMLAGNIEDAGQMLEQMQRDKGKEEAGTFHIMLSELAMLNDVLISSGTSAQLPLQEMHDSELDSASSTFALCVANRVHAFISRGELEQAAGWLEKLDQHSPGETRLVSFLCDFLGAWLAFYKNDLLRAHHLQRRAYKYALELGIPQFEVLSGAAFAQLLFLCDDKKAGIAQLRRVHSLAADIGNPLLEYMVLLVFAQLELAEGRTESAVNAMRYGMGLGRQHGYYQLPWWRHDQLADLCVESLRHGVETQYVRDIVAHHDLQPGVTPVDIADWPWPLRISTFGGLTITRHGNTHGAPEKGKGRPFLLLRILVSLGAREVPASRVADLMWPHVDDDYKTKSLTINLHRLRRLLGNDAAVLLVDGKLSLNDKLVWLDVWAFDALCSSIKETQPAEDPALLASLAERLERMYCGKFLFEDTETEAISQARDDLDNRYSEASDLLEMHLQK